MTTATTNRSLAGGVPVSVRDVRRVFDGGVTALDGVSLEVRAGEFVALLGPSGCGKSTLLRLIAELDPPQAGAIRVGEGEPATGAAPIAFVFQDAHLLPWRNVLRNVTLPLELRGVPANERAAAARHAIEQVGLTDAMNRYPAQLSGGMRMRVSLARALVTRPRLLLLDEPFAALDELTRQRLDEQLYDLWRRLGMTVLFVTHSIEEAVFLAQRAVVFSRRPGRIIADRPIDLPPERPAEVRTEPRFARLEHDLFTVLRQESGR